MFRKRLPALCSFLALGLLLASCAAIGPEADARVHYVQVGPAGAPVMIAYQERGHGKPVLLIHGFGASAYTWRHVEPALEDRYRVISIDLKGFGRSDKPLDEHYSVFDQAELVSEFIDKLGLKDLTVVGHSLGGGVALVLAIDPDKKRRSRITRMVLMDSIAYPQNIPIAFDLLTTPVVGSLGNRLIPSSLKTRAALRLAYHDNSKYTEEDVEAYSAPLRDAGTRHAMEMTARQIMPENLPEIARKYSTIQVPVLVLWCRHDKVVPLAVGWRLHQELPNSKLKVISECGHLPQEEMPDETVATLKAFLAGG